MNTAHEQRQNGNSCGARPRYSLSFALCMVFVGGLLTLTGTARVHAQPATVIVGDAIGLPEETAPVTISLTTQPGGAGVVEVAAVQTFIMFDETFAVLDPQADCSLDPRLTDQTLTTNIIGTPPIVTLIVGVSPAGIPIASFPPGDIVTCNFFITANSQIGDEILLAQDIGSVQVTLADDTVLCGVGSLPPPGVDCGIVDGIIFVGEPPTPTPTETPTPTNTPTATNTPTNTVPPTPTNTLLPVFGGGSNCSIVSGGESNTWGSLIFLLTIPALMLWGRRRR